MIPGGGPIFNSRREVNANNNWKNKTKCHEMGFGGHKIAIRNFTRLEERKGFYKNFLEKGSILDGFYEGNLLVVVSFIR